MERHSLSGYVHYRSVLKPKISKSAYKEIKAYADNNGVSLRNFKDYTGDITEIIEIIDKIKMVARDFPKLINNRYQVVLGLYFEESDEYAGTENHTVTLNGLYFNDSSETCKAYNEKVATGHFVKGTTYKDIIFHELGHVVLLAPVGAGASKLRTDTANNLLKEPKTYYLLIAMALTLPFSSIACIFKGYFYGIQKNYPHVLSNTIEQLIRLILILTVIPKLIEISYVHAAVGLILTFLFTEAASIIVFSICMNKKDVKTMYKLSYSKSDIKDILNLSIPTVTSRIIGNICYFFEPIILTNILLYKGYSHYFILTEYGAYNAYAISTLTIPSFFISAISLALIPEISKYNENNNTYYVKKRLKEACIYTFIIGLISTFCIFIFRNELLFFLYKTTLGTDYIKLLAPFFILFYFESIFASFMQGIGKAKVTLKITIFSGIVKLLFLSILSFLEIGIYGLLIAEIINIILVVFLNYYYINKYFRH